MLLNQLKIADPKKIKILDLIRKKREVSGAELARLTNLQPSTMVYMLRSLKKAGFIEVARLGYSSTVGGKPPTLWRLISELGYIIGMEVIPDEIRATVVDFSSNVIFKKIYSNLETVGEEKLVSTIEEVFQKIIDEVKIDKQKVVGLGIALPGLIDRQKGIVNYSVPLEVKQFALQEQLEQMMNLPIRIVNDANAGALEIKWFYFGDKNLPSNIVYLTINEDFGGIGAGLIFDQKLYEGVSGTAGELVVSLPSLNELIRNGIKKYGEESDVSQLLSLKKLSFSDVTNPYQNSKIINLVLRKISQEIVKQILWITNFINPDLIVIGGDITQAQLLINNFIKPRLKVKAEKLFPHGIVLPGIEFSRFGIFSVAVGATALLLREIFLTPE